MEGNLEKRGWKTTMEELEAKAREELPLGEVPPEATSGDALRKSESIQEGVKTESNQKPFKYDVLEEAIKLREILVEHVAKIKVLEMNGDSKYFPQEIEEALHNLTFVTKTLGSLVAPDKSNYRFVLDKCNEIAKTQIFLLQELMRQTELRKKEKGEK